MPNTQKFYTDAQMTQLPPSGMRTIFNGYMDGTASGAPALRALDSAGVFSNIGAQAQVSDSSDTRYIQFSAVDAQNKVTLNSVTPPVGLLSGTGQYYPVQIDSVQLNGTSVTLDVTPYLVHQSAASFTGTWTAYFAAGNANSVVTIQDVNNALQGVWKRPAVNIYVGATRAITSLSALKDHLDLFPATFAGDINVYFDAGTYAGVFTYYGKSLMFNTTSGEKDVTFSQAVTIGTCFRAKVSNCTFTGNLLIGTSQYTQVINCTVNGVFSIQRISNYASVSGCTLKRTSVQWCSGYINVSNSTITGASEQRALEVTYTTFFNVSGCTISCGAAYDTASFAIRSAYTNCVIIACTISNATYGVGCYGKGLVYIQSSGTKTQIKSCKTGLIASQFSSIIANTSTTTLNADLLSESSPAINTYGNTQSYIART